MSTVLVADDDADIRDLIEFKLTHAGHTVLTACDGVAALSMARAHMPDLLVLDLMMPGMSGLDVCAQLRREPGTASLPIIMLTAKAQEQDVAVGFSAGADDYVVKPFSPRELVSRVSAVLARSRS